MRVLHVTPFFFPARRYGGPIETVLRLCTSLRDAGVDVSVATTAADGPEDLHVPTDRWVDVQGVPVRYFSRTVRVGYGPSVALARFLFEQSKTFDVIHITSTFSFASAVAGYAARAARVPYVVSPHGSLLTWSLRQKRWKKIPYWLAQERHHLLRAAAIHMTADVEREELSRVLRHPCVFVVPNGQECIRVPDVVREKHRVVFLGRIHAKKGFDVLIPAIARVKREVPDVELVIAGPDDGHWDTVRRVIAHGDVEPNVRYVGAVYGEERYRLLASAAAFALTSHSENFGMTVVEAMACGTPVVVSRNCPWSEVEREGAGYWIENTPDDAARAISSLLADPQRAARMGESGRRVASAYRWDSLAMQMAYHYRRIVAEHRPR